MDMQSQPFLRVRQAATSRMQLAEKSEWQITIPWDHISVLKKYKCKYTHTERSGVIQPGTLSVGTGGLGGGVR